MADSIRAKILDALKLKLSTDITWAKLISWETIRVLVTDFPEHELPVIQFYHTFTDYEHQGGRVQASMELNIEICIKSTAIEGVVSQKTLFNYMDDVIRSIGDKPNLGIPGLLHFRYLRDETDAHSLQPLFIGILTFEVIYLTTYTGC